MAVIDDVLKYLGEPYSILNIDSEPVIYRAIPGFDFEVSGIHGNHQTYTLYVWSTSNRKQVVGIYSKIKGKEALKDLLGYCSVKYQNLLDQILVEREL